MSRTRETICPNWFLVTVQVADPMVTDTVTGGGGGGGGSGSDSMNSLTLSLTFLALLSIVCTAPIDLPKIGCSRDFSIKFRILLPESRTF